MEFECEFLWADLAGKTVKILNHVYDLICDKKLLKKLGAWTWEDIL